LTPGGWLAFFRAQKVLQCELNSFLFVDIGKLNFDGAENKKAFFLMEGFFISNIM
jgi:hypothetical protein